jgi:hypothetical protein
VMPSAPARVRLAGRYLAPPLEEEGAAQVIEALVLASPAHAARNARRLAEEAAAHRPRLERESAGEPGEDAPVTRATRTGATEAASLAAPSLDEDGEGRGSGRETGPTARASHMGG